MNTFNILRILFLNSVITLSSYWAGAQAVTYLPPMELYSESDQTLQLIGQINQRYVLYQHKAGQSAEIIYCNEKGEIEGRNSLAFIQAGITSTVNFVATAETVLMLFQEVKDNWHFLKAASINEKGELTQPITCLDSTRLDYYGARAFYSITSSENKEQVLCYRIIKGFSESQILFNGIRLDAKGHTTGVSSFYLLTNTEMETNGLPFLTNKGDCFLAVHDKAGNFRLGTSLHLYQTNFKSNTPTVTEIYFKENKPLEFLMDWSERKQELVAGGLYSNFYTKNLEGAFTAYIKPGVSKVDTVLYQPLEKGFKKELRSGIYGFSLDEVVNSLQSRYFKVQEDGSTVLLTDMFNNFTLSRSSLANNLPGNNRTRATPFSNSPTTNSNSLSANNIPAVVSSTSRSIYQDRAPSATTGSGMRNRQASTTPPTYGGLPSSPTANLPTPEKTVFYASDVSARDAGDVLAINKTMDYKSLLFYTDSSLQQSWKQWVRNLYVPGTPFTNVVILPSKAGPISLLNYEVNGKNMAYLNHSAFRSNGSPLSEKIDPAGRPLLFFKKNIIWWNDHSLLTLYENHDNGQIGIARVDW